MVAETFFHRFKTMAVASVVVSVTCCVAGLFLAAAIDVPSFGCNRDTPGRGLHSRKDRTGTAAAEGVNISGGRHVV